MSQPPQWMMRGVRGATTVPENSEDAIIDATTELLREIITHNSIEESHVASVLFTTTPDLTTAYPARAARLLGWRDTALMGMQEMHNPAGLPRCIRVLIHWNTPLPIDAIVHVYMNGAETLRPDFLYPTNKVVLNHDDTTETGDT